MKIATTQTPENIAFILEVLARIPNRLEAISSQLSPNQLTTPISPGERTPTEILAHILHCEAITGNAIIIALLKKEPLLPSLHPERDLGKLMNYHQRSFTDLQVYFSFRRKTLLSILNSLKEKQWSRIVKEEGKKRRETVYRLARVQALHEEAHVKEIEDKFLV